MQEDERAPATPTTGKKNESHRDRMRPAPTKATLDRVALAGARLRAARKALHISQKAVCAAINVEQSTYSQWETGKHLVDPLAATRIKEHFGITLDWIFAGDLSALPYALALALPADVTGRLSGDRYNDSHDATAGGQHRARRRAS